MSLRIKFILIALVCLILYNEWISYYLHVKTWTQLPLQQDQETLKILIVADPQILSVETEKFFPFSYVAVWDANRFVSRCFQMTVYYLQPDAVVFLGDLIDGGSVSDLLQFTENVYMFKKLFPSNNVKDVLYLPGDNDVGGEGFDFTSSNKVQRFYTAFNSSNPMKLKFTQLYHLNAMPGAHEISPVMRIDKSHFTNDTFRILFSHYPLTAGASKSNLVNINRIKPSIIFSAHDHDSYQLISKKDDPKAGLFKLLRNKGEVLDINLKNDDLFEISVPTCSYRMGKLNFGYGFAELSKNGVLRYTVLWLPSRFAQIWRYFFGLIICGSFLIFPFILYITKKYSNSPLISLNFSTKHHSV